MEEHKIFAQNLEAIRKINNQSIAEFARAADIPKSTFQSIRLNGQTTLDTAIRISNALNLPLDGLVEDSLIPKKIDLVQYMLKSIEWLQILSGEEQEEVLFHFQKILEIMLKGNHYSNVDARSAVAGGTGGDPHLPQARQASSCPPSRLSGRASPTE